jgi:hypothetical protein
VSDVWIPWLNTPFPRGDRPVPAAADGVDPSHKVLIYTGEAERIAYLAVQYPDIETGGDLFGYWTHSGAPVVTYVIGPGVRSRHHATSFYQDERYLHDVGTELYDGHGLQHVGAWHSHHRLGLNQPSAGDLETVWSGMRARHWNRFLLLITTCGDVQEAPVLQNYFLFTADHVHRLRVQTLPGVSPLRDGRVDRREEQPRRRGHSRWRPGPSTPAGRRAAEERFPDAWFTTARGKALLLRTTRRLAAEGISCRMVPSDDGRSLKLVLPDAAVLLGRGFPDEEPRWLAGAPGRAAPWDPAVDFVDWYLQTRARVVIDPPPSAERSDRHASDDPAAERDAGAEDVLPAVHDPGPARAEGGGDRTHEDEQQARVRDLDRPR